ncbi:MAG: alpha/beta fold hydrolase [Thermodesulfobacteriota bacterium]
MKSPFPIHDYPFTPRRFQLADGNCLSYLDEGQGPAVVMLHGNPTWSYFYRRLVLLLHRDHRVIVPDHLGCGLSDKPRNWPYRLADHIGNLDELLTNLDVGPCSLVVHDWGGAIGMGYALRHLSDIRSLVVFNTAAFRSSRIPARIRLCRLPLLGPLLVRGLNAFAGAAIHMAVARPMEKKVARAFLLPYDGWANRIATLRFVQDIPLSPTDPSWQTLTEIEAGLSSLAAIPMLICWGGRDFCFNDHFYHEWQRRFPAARCHYLPEAGHYLLEDAFDEIAPPVAAFLMEKVRPG